MIQDITKRFDKALSDMLDGHTEVKNFVLNHERKPVVLKNLCEQIMGCEKNLLVFDVSRYQQVIDSTAGLFAKTAIGVAEQHAVSDLERQRRIDEQEKEKSILKDFEGEIKEVTEVTEL